MQNVQIQSLIQDFVKIYMAHININSLYMVELIKERTPRCSSISHWVFVSNLAQIFAQRDVIKSWFLCGVALVIGYIQNPQIEFEGLQ